MKVQSAAVINLISVRIILFLTLNSSVLMVECAVLEKACFVTDLKLSVYVLLIHCLH